MFQSFGTFPRAQRPPSLCGPHTQILSLSLSPSSSLYVCLYSSVRLSICPTCLHSFFFSLSLQNQRGREILHDSFNHWLGVLIAMLKLGAAMQVCVCVCVSVYVRAGGAGGRACLFCAQRRGEKLFRVTPAHMTARARADDDRYGLVRRSTALVALDFSQTRLRLQRSFALSDKRLSICV